jgi:hypothetical protein
MFLNLVLLISFQKKYLYKLIGYVSITMQTKNYNEDTKEVTIMRLALFWFKSPNDKIYNLHHSP